ncbi:hypothetical protein RG47T_0914 [Mucilaginibacter polytrichastri]|uniref:Uncharacterized protein n=1 Tax=Mucilaginibacter polytrichastri TaxID=1302689 RepID=A0A1Q5ZUV6_9SPHI|nr:hypothetical protein RG47T_0914 [Mucilaginibacter polytrichastri]
MTTYQGTCTYQFDNRTTIDFKGCFIEFEVQKKGREGNEYAVPNKVYSGDMNKFTEYAGKPPYKNCKVKNKQVFIDTCIFLYW